MAAIVSVSLSAGINAKFLPAGLGDIRFHTFFREGVFLVQLFYSVGKLFGFAFQVGFQPFLFAVELFHFFAEAFHLHDEGVVYLRHFAMVVS